MSKNIRAARPTRRQKELISGMRLNAGQYLVVSETKEAIVLYNKHTGKNIVRYKRGAK